jgi:hypothetical protein
MRLVGCDLHATQQSIAMLDRDTGVVIEKTLTHEGGAVRAFYASIPPPVVVGIEATGSMGWFLRLMEEHHSPPSAPRWSSQLLLSGGVDPTTVMGLGRVVGHYGPRPPAGTARIARTHGADRRAVA